MPRDRLRLGLVGLGARTETLLVSLFASEGVEVAAVCDRRGEAIERVAAVFAAQGRAAPAAFSDHQALIRGTEVDAVLVATSWNGHLPVALDALRAGKHAAIEVGGASSTEELWQLVHASEQSGAACMMLENCCYGRNELMVLNMVRQGVRLCAVCPRVPRQGPRRRRRRAARLPPSAARDGACHPR